MRNNQKSVGHPSAYQSNKMVLTEGEIEQKGKFKGLKLLLKITNAKQTMF